MLLQRLFLSGWLAVATVCPAAFAQGLYGFAGPTTYDPYPIPPINRQQSAWGPEAAYPSYEVDLLEPQLTQLEKLWEGSLQLGLIGSEGNTESFSLRSGFDAKRKTDYNLLTLDLDFYRRTAKAFRFKPIPQPPWLRSEPYTKTINRVFGAGLFDHLHQSTPLTLFLAGTADFDEAQPYNVRVTAHSGIGFRFIDSDRTLLIGRLGGGFAHEVDSPDDRYVPEGLVGLDCDHYFSKRKKLTAHLGYYPNVTDFSEFRMLGEAAWQTLLIEERNLSLKLRVLDRYDSTPYQAKPNDVDYSVLLLWNF